MQRVNTSDIRFFRSLSKSDRHNHCLLGGKRSVIESFYGRKLSVFKAAQPGIEDLNLWIGKELRSFFQLPGAFEKAVEAAFVQAKFDGVTLLEMSIDVLFGSLFKIPPERIVQVLKETHQRVAPKIDFRPELGFPRNKPLPVLLAGFETYMEYDFFQSIDLYDDEYAQPISGFRELYKQARSLGLKCKAHAGEFGSADSVREAVEILELDAVQHGIGAADSPEVMKWLASRNIVLNVCPTSNIKLKRVRSYNTHPVRILFDHGVKVTINTDDVLVFGDGISEQFVKLHKTGLFSLDEIDQIRKTSLE